MFLWLRGQGGRERDPGRQEGGCSRGLSIFKKMFFIVKHNMQKNTEHQIYDLS